MLNLLLDMAVLSTIPFVAFALVLINRDKVASSNRTYHLCLIGLRILLMSVPTLCLVYFLFGLPVYYLFPAGLFFVLMVAISDIEYCLSGDAVGTAIALVLTLPFYTVKQIVLGFPMWGQLASLPEISQARDHSNVKRPAIASSQVDALIGIQGIVSADLRPSGYVEIDNQEYPAKSIDGFFVQQGRAVRVIHVDQKKLIVQCEND